MSILDTIIGATKQHPEIDQQQHFSLVQTALQMFGNGGGLSGLRNNAQSQGIGHIFQSWVGSGPNQAITPEQTQGLLGEDKINQLASRAGVSPGIASAAIAG